MNTAARILVVEDHAGLRAEIVACLRGAGHRIDEAADGRTALAAALEDPPALMVLDLSLPGLDGTALCAHLRARGRAHVPVLMLTARDTLYDKLAGFAAGADDYLIKPFAGEELVARVAALLRRASLGMEYQLCIGSLTLDRRARSAARDGQPLDLPPIAYAILEALALAYPRAVTRSDLIEAVWAGEAPESDPLRSHVYELRRQLDKPFERAMLKTVHGAGFRLESDE